MFDFEKDHTRGFTLILIEVILRRILYRNVIIFILINSFKYIIVSFACFNIIFFLRKISLQRKISPKLLFNLNVLMVFSVLIYLTNPEITPFASVLPKQLHISHSALHTIRLACEPTLRDYRCNLLLTEGLTVGVHLWVHLYKFLWVQKLRGNNWVECLGELFCLSWDNSCMRL